MGKLIHSRLAAHVELPQAIRDAMPTIGLAVPRLRSLYYFADVMHAPEAYVLDAEGVEVFFANLEADAEFEWAHCLAVALETEFRVTGRVILQ